MNFLKIKGKSFYRSSIAACLFVAVSSTSAHALPAVGDYDGDGLSDMSVVSVQRNSNNTGTTTWKARLSSTGGEKISVFNVPADALIQGKFWLGDTKVYPGIVHVSSASQPLNWYLKMPNGQDFYLQYGIPGDSIPTQGDLDCDGITDLTVVRNGSDGFKRWIVRASTRGFQPVEELFGLNSDRAGIIDVNGDGCAEKVVLRGNTYQWFAQKFGQGFFTTVQWGLPGDFPLLPQDVNGDNVPDYVIVRPFGHTQMAYVRYGNNNTESFLIPSLSDAVPMLGKFLEFNKSGFAWWQRSQNLAAQLLPNRVTPFIFNFGQTGNALVRPDGTVVQANDSGRFNPSAPPPPPPSGGGGSGGSGGLITSVRCDQNLQFRGGNVWNPSTSKGKGKLVLTADFWQRVSALAAFNSAGQKFEDTSPFPRQEEGGRFRAYWDTPVRNMPRPTKIVVRRNDGRHFCLDVPNPTTKYR